MRRIFIGIPIAKELPFDFAQGLRQEKGIRWIQPKNLHVTLMPPWYSEDYEAVIMKLETLKGKVAPFEIKFEKISFGPNIRQPRLIWASGRAPKQIEDLKYKIYKVLGQQPEKRQFQLHATLARFRAEDFRKFAVKTLNEQINWQQRVTAFALYESHLSPYGADYEILAEFQLD